MSTALASARRRRAGPESVAPAPGVRQTTSQPSLSSANTNQPNMGAGLTLPQVIALVDKRLINLEQIVQTQGGSKNQEESVIDGQLSAILEEYNTRFDIIADELASLKDTLMKLQTYTMEVNKTLMEERIQILSEAPSTLEEALNAVDN